MNEACRLSQFIRANLGPHDYMLLATASPIPVNRTSQLFLVATGLLVDFGGTRWPPCTSPRIDLVGLTSILAGNHQMSSRSLLPIVDTVSVTNLAHA